MSRTRDALKELVEYLQSCLLSDEFARKKWALWVDERQFCDLLKHAREALEQGDWISVEPGSCDAREALKFWINADDMGYCIEWIGASNDDGYGHCRFRGKTELAHRVAFILMNGDIPADLHILHHCDNRKCVNPDHLYAGTHLDNMRDMMRRSRNRVLTASSRYRGVAWREDSKNWRAYIRTCGKTKSLGSYDTEEEAARVYDSAALATFGTDADLNFPEPPKSVEGGE